jgi:hypothetical protein
VGHSGFESDEGGEMGFVGRVVLREGSDSSSGMFGSSSRHEPKVSSSGSSEFTVRHAAL